MFYYFLYGSLNPPRHGSFLVASAVQCSVGWGHMSDPRQWSGSCIRGYYCGELSIFRHPSGNNKANTRTVSYCLSDGARSINQESYVFDPLITRKDEE